MLCRAHLRYLFSTHRFRFAPGAGAQGGGSPRVVPRTIIPEVRTPATGNALYVFALPEEGR